VKVKYMLQKKSSTYLWIICTQIKKILIWNYTQMFPVPVTCWELCLWLTSVQRS